MTFPSSSSSDGYQHHDDNDSDVGDVVYQCNDGDDDDDDDGVNFEPEQDDGISSNFLHRPPPFLAHCSPPLTYP